jgi:hypothetical protein
MQAVASPLTFPRPPDRRRVVRRNLDGARRDQAAALVGIPAQLRIVSAAHVALELVDRRGLRPPHDVERYGLTCLAAVAMYFQKAIAGIERVAECRRRLFRPAQSQHALIPSIADQLVGFLSGRGGCSDILTELPKSGLKIWCPWVGTSRPVRDSRQAAGRARTRRHAARVGGLTAPERPYRRPRVF